MSVLPKYFDYIVNACIFRMCYTINILINSLQAELILIFYQLSSFSFYNFDCLKPVCILLKAIKFNASIYPFYPSNTNFIQWHKWGDSVHNKIRHDFKI